MEFSFSSIPNSVVLEAKQLAYSKTLQVVRKTSVNYLCFYSKFLLNHCPVTRKLNANIV
jgi:hypothetical protein